MDLSKTTVFLGESGDTDYEQLIGGVHKSVILKGVGCGSRKQLHANRSYPLADVVALDSPNIVQTSEECKATSIRTALRTLGVLKC